MENLTKDDILKIIKYYEEHTDKTHGGSIISYMKKKLSPNLSGYTKKTTATLKQFGDIPVKKIAIYRTPLHGILNQIVNIISIGKWNDLQKKYGFDKFYHLALIVHLENNKTIMIQKLDVIDVSAAFKTASDTEIDYIDNYDANMKLTINDMFANARRRVEDKLWFGYDALYNNCQYFIKYILENSNLYDAQAQEFLFQNLEELTKELPGYVGKIMNSVTNTAATITNVTGRGKPSQYVLDDISS